MKKLLTITEESFGRTKAPDDIQYKKRSAARAVLLNDAGGVYLLNVSTQGYHKLPGGGIDDGEETKAALRREICEEVGCDAEIQEEIGEVVEYRHYEDESLEQHSYCYLAKQAGELGEQNLEQSEITEGHDLVVAASVDEAIKILESDAPKNTEGEYIRLRDLTILNEAKKLMTSLHKWQHIHTEYKSKDWINKPSIFAEQAVAYFPKTGKILELGAGHGQDSRYFAQNGYEVISTDSGAVALKENREKNKEAELDISVARLDLAEKFPFEAETFDIVYAHLSLHYFSNEKTTEIFDEIYRVLKPGGVFAFFTNSTDDPEFNTGLKIEDYYFEIEGINKRYLNSSEAQRFARKFETILCDNNGETYKDSAKGIHNLIRYIGRK